MAEWKTIDSAPKDGARILTCGGTFWWVEDEVHPKTGVSIVSWYSDNIFYDGEFFFRPSYWMPLPTPPVSP